MPEGEGGSLAWALCQRRALGAEMLAAAGLTRLVTLEGVTEACIKSGQTVEK